MADPIRDWLMDANGDRAIVDGDFATVAGAAAVPQGIEIRVRTFLSEIFTDESEGVDWIGQILVKDADPLVARELVREAIADTPDVVDVIGSEVTTDSARTGTVAYQVSSVYSASPVVDVIAGVG